MGRTRDGPFIPLAKKCRVECSDRGISKYPQSNHIEILMEKNNYPATLSEYEILDCVGGGRYSRLHRAFCSANETMVYVRIFDLDRFFGKEFDKQIGSLTKEIRALKICRHQNMTQYYACFIEDSHLYFVVEYLEGSVINILKFYNRGKLEEGVYLTDNELLRIILYNTLLGLENCHKNGLMHRNVKGDYILVSKSGEIKLSGFFGASFLIKLSGRTTSDFNYQSRMDVSWTAPEILEQVSRYDQKVDIWSFGMTILEFVCGKIPFQSENQLGVYYEILTKPSPSLQDDGVHIFNPLLKEVVDLCLKKKPSERPTASELLKHKYFAKLPKNMDKYVRKALKLSSLPSLPDRNVIMTRIMKKEGKKKAEENIKKLEKSQQQLLSQQGKQQQQQQQQQQLNDDDPKRSKSPTDIKFDFDKTNDEDILKDLEMNIGSKKSEEKKPKEEEKRSTSPQRPRKKSRKKKKKEGEKRKKTSSNSEEKGEFSSSSLSSSPNSSRSSTTSSSPSSTSPNRDEEEKTRNRCKSSPTKSASSLVIKTDIKENKEEDHDLVRFLKPDDNENNDDEEAGVAPLSLITKVVYRTSRRSSDINRGSQSSSPSNGTTITKSKEEEDEDEEDGHQKKIERSDNVLKSLLQLAQEQQQELENDDAHHAQKKKVDDQIIIINNPFDPNIINAEKIHSGQNQAKMDLKKRLREKVPSSIKTKGLVNRINESTSPFVEKKFMEKKDGFNTLEKKKHQIGGRDVHIEVLSNVENRKMLVFDINKKDNEQLGENVDENDDIIGSFQQVMKVKKSSSCLGMTNQDEENDDDDDGLIPMMTGSNTPKQEYRMFKKDGKKEGGKGGIGRTEKEGQTKGMRKKQENREI